MKPFHWSTIVLTLVLISPVSLYAAGAPKNSLYISYFVWVHFKPEFKIWVTGADVRRSRDRDIDEIEKDPNGSLQFSFQNGLEKSPLVYRMNPQPYVNCRHHDVFYTESKKKKRRAGDHCKEAEHREYKFQFQADPKDLGDVVITYKGEELLREPLAKTLIETAMSFRNFIPTYEVARQSVSEVAKLDYNVPCDSIERALQRSKEDTLGNHNRQNLLEEAPILKKFFSCASKSKEKAPAK